MTRLIVVILYCVMATLAIGEPVAVSPERVFDVAGRPAREGVVVAPWVETPEAGASFEVPSSPMLRELSGVLGEVSLRELARLRRSVAVRTRVPPDVSDRRPVASLLLRNQLGTGRVEIERVEHGWVMASSTDGPVRARLEGEVIERLLGAWGAARPDPSAADTGHVPGTVFECAQPLTPASIRLDDRTVGERFAAGGRSPFEAPMTRDLSRERLFARLPEGYRADRPAGVLVWISPTPRGEPPTALFEAADTHGLICLSFENSGNERPPLDRSQLALDAVATASDRWWVDRERVYLSGMSGGGRMTSMLWACFPDVFTGGVAVVGMNSHHMVPIGDGRFWPKTHEKALGALGRLLSGQRLAGVSGPTDYNFKEMQARGRRMAREGLGVRMFDFADLGHAMPTGAQFEQAVAWVDAPVVARRWASGETALRVLESSLERYGERPPSNPRERAVLERVTELGPWTEPAWRAAVLLGYAESAGADADED
jgi:hypothetical protein